MGVICILISRVRIFFVHLLDCERNRIQYFCALPETVFDGALFLDLCILAVDKGFAFIAADGKSIYFCWSGDAMDGYIAADDRKIFIEILSARLCIDNQILNPLLLLIRLPIDIFVEEALCSHCCKKRFELGRKNTVGSDMNQKFFS